MICFSCGGGLCKWAEHDDPWEQHALWYKTCNYLQLVKGPDFIATVEKKYGIRQNEKKNAEDPTTTSISKPTSTPQQEDGGTSSSSTKEPVGDSLPQKDGQKDEKNDETKTNDTRLCKICFVNEYNTVFLPCGHILACAKCAATQKDCPLCRKRFKSIHRIFLP